MPRTKPADRKYTTIVQFKMTHTDKERLDRVNPDLYGGNLSAYLRETVHKLIRAAEASQKPPVEDKP